jgi:apolipoprotein N-acyltransferase
MTGSVPRLHSFAAAAATALLLNLAMPGFTGWWPLLFVALVPLLVCANRLPPMRSGCMGMFCGLLYNIGLLHWIVIVLGRYGGLPSWISVPGLGLLALYMAVYTALFCLLFAVPASGKQGRGQALALLWGAPVLWVGMEFLRSFFLSGFPWMDIGYGLYGVPLLIQSADLGGHLLVSFLVVQVNGMLAWLVVRRLSDHPQQEPFFILPVIGSLVFLLSLGAYSGLRLQQGFIPEQPENTAVISVIQGNISQDEKWTPERKQETVNTYIKLSKTGVTGKGVDLLVWPETALPFFPQQDGLTLDIVRYLEASSTPLLTGAPFYVPRPERGKGGKLVDYYNSALLIAPDGQLAGRYNKQHLVPFGEYVPLRQYLPFLEPLVVAAGDFTAGDSFQPLEIGRIRAGVLICFESIFPEIARKEVVNGANVLVNLTNDAWYGRSSAPYQSLAMAVFRAVENRRALVRAANTGISGVIQPSGRIAIRSELFVPAALTGAVNLMEKQTFFVRLGHWFGLLCLVCGGLSVGIVFWRSRKNG